MANWYNRSLAVRVRQVPQNHFQPALNEAEARCMNVTTRYSRMGGIVSHEATLIA